MGYFAIKKCGNYIYSSSFATNAMIIMDDGFDIIDTMIFEDELDIPNLHRKIIRYGDTLIFVPHIGNKICIYNLINKSFDYVALNTDNSELSFADAMICDGRLFLFPRYLSQELMIMNLKSNIVCKNKEWNEQVKRAGINENQKFDTFSIAQNEECFWIVPMNSGKIIEYNSKNFTIKVINIDYEQFRNVTRYKNKLWITGMSGNKIFNVDIDNYRIEAIEGEKEGKDYHRIIVEDQKILLIPVSGYGVDIVESNLIKPFIDIKTVEDKDYCFGDYVKLENTLCFLPLMDDNLKLINLENRQIAIRHFDDDRLVNKKKHLQFKKTNFSIENENYGLNNLIEGVKNDEY